MKTLLTPPAAPKPGDKHQWGGLDQSALHFALANNLCQHQRTTLIVAPSMDAADRSHKDLQLFLKDKQTATGAPAPQVHLFADWETLAYDSFSPHQDIISERMRCLYELSLGQQSCVIVSAKTLLQRLVPTHYVQQKSLVLKPEQRLSRDEFQSNLEICGYNRVDTVYQHGEYAMRGALLDVFPMGTNSAYRIEFFDNEIESLRTFDPESQRTIARVDKVELLPGRECPLDKDAITRFKENWHQLFDVDHRQCPIYQDICEGIPSPGIEYFLPLFFDETANIFDYLPKDALICTLGNTEQAFEEFWRDTSERYQSRCGDMSRPILTPQKIFLPINEAFAAIKPFARISVFTRTLEEKQGNYNFACNPMPHLAIEAKAQNPLHYIEEFISHTDKRVFFCAESDGRREMLKENFAKIDLQPDEFPSLEQAIASTTQIGLVVANIQSSINSDESQLIIISEQSLFGQRVSQSRRRKKNSDESDNIIKNLTELKLDAPVVHLEHGVGRYKGLQTIEHGGNAEEFLVLQYANDAKLYVPVGSLQLISRYSGSDQDHAPLHRLGSDQWSKAKRKAAEQVRDVAAELLDIYARRQARQGFKYSNPREAYAQFSAGFPFEETADQEAAINAVRNDMFSTNPMDRLVCGDVGFGKTEVAMRASFIAVQNSKQVVVLVPTTLLAHQHFENFKDRFADWPINIEVMSRFKSGKETEEIQQKIEKGHIDIIIGTHKLIQGDTTFANLGLLIIDEEHRFGVRQKEKLKSLRTEVDILTMTATPIPRTLNMSMNGIRDLSIIATPPAKRLSVKTFIRQNDTNLIKEALLREIMRGGQVYYLHNEVKSIEKTAREIEQLIPEAKVRIGHGQMRERELESVMSDFYHKRFNILVCTTIIETGIDVPSANTIIIDRADHFGLAQLHQLRGRVGRSHHQAYAYLLTPHKKNMTGDAIKRLKAIEEAQDLGAGFTLASHDMEIRGAGELLGDDQSGQMQAIGFTLYMDMLDRAVQAIQQGKPIDLEKPFDAQTDINLRMPALIPDDYLPDVHTRLTLYKRIASTQSDDELDELQVEMIDRFGLLPEPTKNLIRQTKLRTKAQALGITKIDANETSGKLEFGSETQVEPLTLIKMIQTQPTLYQMVGAQTLKFKADMNDANQRLSTIHTLIDTLQKTG